MKKVVFLLTGISLIVSIHANSPATAQEVSSEASHSRELVSTVPMPYLPTPKPKTSFELAREIDLLWVEKKYARIRERAQYKQTQGLPLSEMERAALESAQ